MRRTRWNIYSGWQKSTNSQNRAKKLCWNIFGRPISSLLLENRKNGSSRMGRSILNPPPPNLSTDSEGWQKTLKSSCPRQKFVSVPWSSGPFSWLSPWSTTASYSPPIWPQIPSFSSSLGESVCTNTRTKITVCISHLFITRSGLMEIPAYLLTPIPASKLGRRPTTCATFMLTGVCMLGLSQIDSCESAKKWWCVKAFLSSNFHACNFIIIKSAQLMRQRGSF